MIEPRHYQYSNVHRGECPLITQGEGFISRAKKYLQDWKTAKQKFSISVPRASYITDAFINFKHSVQNVPFDVYYQETNLWNDLNNILTAGLSTFGIICYDIKYDRFFKTMLQEKAYVIECIAEFKYVLIAIKSVLANTFFRYSQLFEITHADTFGHSLTFSAVKKKRKTYQ